jgi:hypothetical protein
VSLVDDTPAVINFTLTATQTILIIYINNVPAMGGIGSIYGAQYAISKDGVDVANTWDSGSTTSNFCFGSTTFWIGTLAAGSHTIKGRFASNLASNSASIQRRILLVYIFDGDEFQYIDNNTLEPSSSNSFIDDPQASLTFTPSANCKALYLYNIGNAYLDTESVYGSKTAISIASVDYGQTEKSPNSVNYSANVFTCYATSLAAISTTVKGRFASNQNTETVTISRRQLGVLLLSDTTILDIVDSTTLATTNSNILIDDPYATINRTTSNQRELLSICVATKRSGVSDSAFGETYGINIDSVDKHFQKRAPGGTSYACSESTVWAETLLAGSHTIKGRFASTISGGASAKISARVLISLIFGGELQTILSDAKIATRHWQTT